MNYLRKYTILIMLVSPVGIASTLLNELSMCAKNNDSLQRLVCYDKLAKESENSQPMQQTLQHSVPSTIETTASVHNTTETIQKMMPVATSALPEDSAINQPQQPAEIAKQQQANFGQENKQRSKDLMSEIQVTIRSIKKAPYGETIITLKNGQVWRQTDSTRLTLRKDQLITIERGALGSFFIGKEGTNKRIRAKRVK